MIDHSTLPATIDIGQAARLLRERPDIQMIDVRTSEEFAAAHIPGSQNIPLAEIARRSRDIAASITGPALLVCRSSARAQVARDLLARAGKTDLHVLDGGVVAWAGAGLDLASDRTR